MGRHVRERARARRGGKRGQSSIGPVKRLFTGIAGALGLAALLRLLRRRQAPDAPAADPAEELRRKLAEARTAEDDRDDFDAAEGQPLDAAEPERPRTIEERRRAIHEQAQDALEEMRRLDERE